MLSPFFPFAWLYSPDAITIFCLFTFCFVLVINRLTREDRPYRWSDYVVRGTIAAVISGVIVVAASLLCTPQIYQTIPGLDRLAQPTAFVFRENVPEMLLTVPVSDSTSVLSMTFAVTSILLVLALLLHLRGGITTPWRLLIIGTIAGMHIAVPLSYPAAVWANDAITFTDNDGNTRPLSRLSSDAFRYGIFPQLVYNNSWPHPSIEDLNIGGVSCMDQIDLFDLTDNDGDTVPDVYECRYAVADLYPQEIAEDEDQSNMSFLVRTLTRDEDEDEDGYTADTETYIYRTDPEQAETPETFVAIEAQMQRSHERAMVWGPWSVLVLFLLVGPATVLWERPRGFWQRVSIGAAATGMAAAMLYMVRVGALVSFVAGGPLYDLAVRSQVDVSFVMPLGLSVLNTILATIIGLVITIVVGAVVGAVSAGLCWLPARTTKASTMPAFWMTRFAMLTAPMLILLTICYIIVFVELGTAIGDIFREYGFLAPVQPELLTGMIAVILMVFTLLAQGWGLWQLYQLESSQRIEAYSMAQAAWIVGLFMVLPGILGSFIATNSLSQGGKFMLQGQFLLCAVLGLEMMFTSHRLLTNAPRPRPAQNTRSWLSAGAWAVILPAFTSNMILIAALKLVLVDVFLIAALADIGANPVGIRDINTRSYTSLETVVNIAIVMVGLILPLFSGTIYGWLLSGDRTWRREVARLRLVWRWMARRLRLRVLQRVPAWLRWSSGIALIFSFLVVFEILVGLTVGTIIMAAFILFMVWSVWRNRESRARTPARLLLLGASVVAFSLYGALDNYTERHVGGVTRLERNDSELLTFETHRVGRDLDYNLYEDRDGNIWFSSNGIPLTRYNPEDGTWRSFDMPDPYTSDSRYPTLTTHMAQVPSSNRYLLTRGDHLYYFDPTLENAIDTDRFQRPGEYMIGYDADKLAPVALSDRSFSYSPVFDGTCDPSTAWAWGMADPVPPTAEANYHCPDADRQAHAIMTTGNSIYIGFENRGLLQNVAAYSLPGLWTAFQEEYDSQPPVNVWDFAAVNGAPVLIPQYTTDDIVTLALTTEAVIDADTGSVIIPLDSALDLRAMAYDEVTGLLWIGGKGGLYWIDLSANTPELTVEMDDVQVTALEIGTDEVPLLRSDRHLWVGTENGLIAYDPTNGDQFVLVTENAALATNHVAEVLSDSHGNVWVSTYEVIGIAGPRWSLFLVLGLYVMGVGGFTVRDFRLSPAARGRAMGHELLSAPDTLYPRAYDTLAIDPSAFTVLRRAAATLDRSNDQTGASALRALLALVENEPNTLNAYVAALQADETRAYAADLRRLYHMVSALTKAEGVRDITVYELATAHSDKGVNLFTRTDSLQPIPAFLPAASAPVWEKLAAVGVQLRKYQEVDGTGDRLSYLAAALTLSDEASAIAGDLGQPDGPLLVTVTRRWRDIINESIGSVSGHAEIRAELRTRQVRRDNHVTLVLRLSNHGQAAAEDVNITLTLDGADDPIEPVHMIRLAPDRSATAEFTISPPDMEMTRAAFSLTWGDRTGTDHTASFADEVRFYEGSERFERIPNPYIVGHPVKSDEMFFGRGDIFQFIEENISGSTQDRTIVLYGQRRTGKTSLLYQLVNGRLGERFIPLLIDMQELALLVNRTEDLLGELAYALHRALNGAGVDVASLDDDQPGTRTFNRYLDQIEDALGDRRVIIIFDEFELIESKIVQGKLDANFLDYMRSMIQHRDQLVFMFTGTHRLEEMGHDYWSILFNIALYRQVSYLTETDAVALIRGPVTGALTVDDLAVEKILRLTNRHPYFIQLICWAMVNLCNERERNYASINDVNDALEQILTTGEGHFAYIWQQANSSEQIVLGLLAHALRGGQPWVRLDDLADLLRTSGGHTFNREQLLATIDGLVGQDVIEVAGEGTLRYRFRLEVLQQWVARSKSIAALVERLDDNTPSQPE